MYNVVVYFVDNKTNEKDVYTISKNLSQEESVKAFEEMLHDLFVRIGSFDARGDFIVKFRTEGKSYYYYDMRIWKKSLWKNHHFHIVREEIKDENKTNAE